MSDKNITYPLGKYCAGNSHKMKVLTVYFILLVVFLKNAISFDPKISQLKTIFNYVKNKADDVLENAAGNTQCANDLKALFTDLLHRKKWAFEMVDSSGKVPSGLLSGNYYFVGSFDQCLNIHEVRGEDVIDGQYCTVALVPSKEHSNDFSILLDSVAMLNILGYNMSSHAADVLKLVKLTYGLCIPQSCSIGNLQKIWDYIEHTLKIPVHVLFVDLLCRSREVPIQPYSVDKYIYAAFGIYILIVLTSTWYDVMIYQYLEDHKKHQNNQWILFSLYTNVVKLFSYTRNHGHLECINGIKAISMMWVVFGHRMLLNGLIGAVNGLYIFECAQKTASEDMQLIPRGGSNKSQLITHYVLLWKKNIENSFVIAASFSVDTFLLMSGLLLSYGYLKYKSIFKKEGNLPLTPFYVYRYLRLTPALLATILFYISLYKKLSDGPIWPAVAAKAGFSCLNTWWITLLFATNLINVNYQCVEQSWYLAVDSQLYFISPIILISLQKKPRKTIYACLGACLVSGIYTFIITINNNYGAIYFEGNRAYHENIYQPTFVRMPPWLIGIILGYMVFKYQHVRIPQRTNIFLWIFSLSLMVYLILIHLTFTRNDYLPVRSAMFNSCARSAWAVAVALIVFSCTTGHGGVVNEFLALPIFQILTRLSYSMYLVNLGVIAYFVGGKKTTEYFSNVKGVHDFVGDLFFTFVVGVIWCLLFESPFIAISKMIINKELGTELVKSAVESMRREKKNYGKRVNFNADETLLSEKKLT